MKASKEKGCSNWKERSGENRLKWLDQPALDLMEDQTIPGQLTFDKDGVIHE